jgi:hypothetical protein
MYGLIVQSDFVLSLANAEPGSSPFLTGSHADIQVSLGSCDQIFKESIVHQFFRGSIDGLGHFLIINGDRIIAEPEKNVSTEHLCPAILGSAMAILLQQRGLLVLHASCVAIDDQAIAFLGVSGAGKSTMASAFHYMHGYPLITDDLLAIDLRNGHPVVFPSLPLVKLFPDAAIALGHSPSAFPSPATYQPKLIQNITLSHLQERYPLRKLYLLGIGHHHRILPMSDSEALLSLIHHSRDPKALNTPTLQAQHFMHCSALAQTTPIGRLERPRALNELPKIINLVEHDLNLSGT